MRNIIITFFTWNIYQKFIKSVIIILSFIPWSIWAHSISKNSRSKYMLYKLNSVSKKGIETSLYTFFMPIKTFTAYNWHKPFSDIYKIY